MLRYFLGTLFLVGGLVSTLLMLYYFIFMLGSVRPEKKRYLPLLGPAMFLLPQLWDQAGNRARIRALLFVVMFAVCYAGIAFVVNFLPLPD